MCEKMCENHEFLSSDESPISQENHMKLGLRNPKYRIRTLWYTQANKMDINR